MQGTWTLGFLLYDFARLSASFARTEMDWNLVFFCVARDRAESMGSFKTNLSQLQSNQSLLLIYLLSLYVAIYCSHLMLPFIIPISLSFRSHLCMHGYSDPTSGLASIPPSQWSQYKSSGDYHYLPPLNYPGMSSHHIKPSRFSGTWSHQAVMDMSCLLGLRLEGKSQPMDIICLSYGSMDVELDSENYVFGVVDHHGWLSPNRP